MSDELRRRFQDKVQGRGSSARRAAPPSVEAAAADAVIVRGLEHGLFPAAASLLAHCTPGTPLVRLTLEVGAALRRPAAWLGPSEIDRLLDLCPGLHEHECGSGGTLRYLVSGGDSAAPGAPADDALEMAHLVEHVALDLLAATARQPRSSGAACAHRGEAGLCDVFLECSDGPRGRAVAVLATAAVRDLGQGRDRAPTHRRCRDLLAFLMRTGRSTAAPEDVAAGLGCDLPAAQEALQALSRLGFLAPIPAPFTFSSATGTLYRRAPT